MGLTTTKLELRNPRRPDLPAVEMDALADTGSDLMCIPPRVQLQLGLEEAETRTIVLADGTRRSVPYVGPLQLRFANRTGFGGARYRWAARGTAPTSDCSMSPRTYRNRIKALNAVAILLSQPTLRRSDCESMKALSAAGSRRRGSKLSSSGRSNRKARTYCR